MWFKVKGRVSMAALGFGLGLFRLGLAIGFRGLREFGFNCFGLR